MVDLLAARPAARIAVLVPTYNEALEVLTPTVAAAIAMRLPHETWVLDDGGRPEVARLAQDLGARYLAREDHVSAKAGNINHAMGLIEADFVAILGADHVASPGRNGDARRPVRVPVVLRVSLVLSVAAAAWYAATLLGARPVRYEARGRPTPRSAGWSSTSPWSS